MADDWRAAKTAQEHTALLVGDQPVPSAAALAQGIVNVGPFARWVPIDKGARFEVKNPSGEWIVQQTWTEE